MHTVKAGLTIPRALKAREEQSLKDLAEKNGINLIVATQNHTPLEAYDVNIVHESFLKDQSAPARSGLILLIDKDHSHAQAYKNASLHKAISLVEFPFKARDLISAIREAYEEGIARRAQNMKDRSVGTAISFSSFKSGVGKSILAYNVSTQLSRIFEADKLCLVDLNRPLPASPALLDISVAAGWDSIRPLLLDKSIDKQRLASVIKPTPYGFMLLASTASPETAPLTEAELSQLVMSVKSSFSVSVFDMPAVSSFSALSELEVFDKVIFVINPASTCIANVAVAVPYLKKHHQELFKKSLFVVNRNDRRHEKTIKALEERLEVAIFDKIIDDPDAVEVFTSRGQLFTDPSLLITRDMSRFSQNLFKRLF